MRDFLYMPSNLEMFQGELQKRLLSQSDSCDFATPKLLQKLSEIDDDLLKFTLGDFGTNFKSLIEKLDINHPDIINIFEGIVSDDNQFSKDCLELLLIGKFAKSKKLNNVIPVCGQQFIKSKVPRQIYKKIELPFNKRSYVRFLNDPQQRSELRCLKCMQTIDLLNIHKKTDDIWDSLPDSFAKFLRFNSAYEDDIFQAERKVARYEELGCTSLAGEIKKNIELLKENSQVYFGFNRITMTNTALILAKSLNFKFEVETTDSVEICKITVPRNIFSFNFDPNFLEDDFVFEPRVYPLHELMDIANDSVKKIIEVLENFPDAGNKPVFDHYGVVVPGIKFPLIKDELYTFFDESGVLRSYNERDEAVRSLDKILIKRGDLCPVILGERDGKCYFISYFY
jgi:hypothetical protein